MSSGRRQVVFNNQERAISIDLNRLQKFASADAQELLRYMLDGSASDDLDAGDVQTFASGLASPLRAEIIGGLAVRPQIGTPFCTVEGGVLNAIEPDGGIDDSVYKYIRHVETGEPLEIAPNASSAVRIDVIECQIASTQATVTDSRDVFHPTSGLFVPTKLTKEQKGYLVFRVRQGVAGAGFPGTATGWLPLAIASVPSLSTSTDTVTFWDVRPLLGDRQFAPSMLTQEVAPGPKILGAVSVHAGVGAARFSATCEAFHNGRRLGGRLRRGTPGADADFLTLDTSNQEGAGATLPLSPVLYFLYLLTPFGLPRWARYTDVVAGVRRPRSPRGIPVLSMIGPRSLTGVPSAAISLPDGLGFASAATSAGVCIWASVVRTSGALCHALANGHVQTHGRCDDGAFIDGSYDPARGTVAFTALENTHYPAIARALLVQLTAQIRVPPRSAAEVNYGVVQRRDAIAADDFHLHVGEAKVFANPSDDAATMAVDGPIVRLPLILNYPTNADHPPARRLFEWSAGSAAAVLSPRLHIVGWDVGP